MSRNTSAIIGPSCNSFGSTSLSNISTSTDMTTVFHVRPYGKSIEIQSNLRRKKIHRTNQGANFLGGSFSNRDNVKTPIQFGRGRQLQCLKR